MASLRNVDRSDREVLHIMEQVADADGIVSTEAFAAALDIGPNDHMSGAGRVASRLARMASLGFVQRVDHKAVGRPARPSLWIVTPIGQSLLTGRLSASVANTLDRQDVGGQLLVLRRLLQASYRSAPATAAVRREYLYNAAQRNGHR